MKVSDTQEQSPKTETPQPQTPSSTPSPGSDPGKGKYQDPSRFTTNEGSKSEWGGDKRGDTAGEK
jgi:hypothetical protein